MSLRSRERGEIHATSHAGPFWRSRLLYFALAVSAILHFDMLMLLDATFGGAPSRSMARARYGSPPVKVLATLRRSSPTPDPPAALQDTAVRETVALQPSPEQSSPPSPAQAPALAPPLEGPASPETFDKTGIVTPAVPHYFTPGELSRRPHLLSFVEISANADSAPAAPARARFRILINEQGGVDQVVVDGSDLPAIFEQATRDAFLIAKYAPGEIDGVPVRSQILIEVSYDEPAELQTLLK